MCVHVTSLPSDYYHYEAEKHRLKGERSGMSYRLGDGVTVQVARVDLDERKIDFELADDKPRPHRSNRGRKKPASGGASTQGKQGAGQDGNAAKKSRDGKPRRRSRRGKGDKRG